MSTVKSLFEHTKAVILATKNHKTNNSIVYVYDLINKRIERFEPIGSNLNWNYAATMEKNADLTARLINSSIVYDAKCLILPSQLETEIGDYWCYLVINNEVVFYTDTHSSYVPNGHDLNGTALYVEYTHSEPESKTPHSIALFALAQYQQILQSEKTISAIMNFDV